ncbi:MAG: hypothetical protein Q9195_002897 [Heterodermia aff. obscurata]
MIVKVIGLISCLGGYVMASPTVAGVNALSLTERTALSGPAHEAAVTRRFVPIIHGLEGVLLYASETLAAQLEGLATSVKELQVACAHGTALTSRLATQGYNTTFILNEICDASKKPTLATDAEIQNKTLEASTRIWIVQALGAIGGNFNKLCNIIDIDAANSVGLNGNFVKEEICGTGG